ncbi:MAG: RNA polymerase sporulation sigma factor SigH, partial [Thermoleophilia bacterium]|nr:RNA polymerase sporulation sigma factor SigH [Thermoleophilia bacterium]
MAVSERRQDGERPARTYARAIADLDEQRLVDRARRGDTKALDLLIKRYVGFVRMKASSYFIAGGDADDLLQEGLIGLYKAVRDYRRDKEASFRSFAELCITRQIITAIKTATRNKHAPLNQYVSFSHTPAGRDVEVDCTIGESLPGSEVEDPAVQIVSTQELRSLVDHMTTRLSPLEAQALTGYLEGRSYEQIAEQCGCDPKTVDNALQRVKRKVGEHLERRRVP